MMGAEEAKNEKKRELGFAVGLSLCAAIAFYFSTKATLHDLDYTNQIASALLHGHLGLQEKPPDWLNEMIPWEGRYYSAFPLGAVLSMLPVALLRNMGLIQGFPGHVLAALIAGLCVYFFFQLTKAFKGDWNNSSPIRPLALPAHRSRLLRRSGCEGWIGEGARTSYHLYRRACRLRLARLAARPASGLPITATKNPKNYEKH